jgi:hypothetical protein
MKREKFEKRKIVEVKRAKERIFAQRDELNSIWLFR